MKRTQSKGFTLIEVMVGMVIMVTAFVAALTTLEMVGKGQRSNEESLAITSARNQVVSILLDDTSWSKMVGPPGGTDNPKLSCLLKQDSNVLTDQDCFGAKDPLVIFNIKGLPYIVNGVTAYDFRQATQGFSIKGQPCNSFVPAPGVGDPLCPYQMVVDWAAVCSAAPCVNPVIQFNGTARFNSPLEQVPPNVGRLKFKLLKSRLYCPASTLPGGHTTISPDVNTGLPDQVRSNFVTDVPTVGTAMTDVVSAPCRRVVIGFTEDLNSGVVMSPNNTSSIFLRNETTGSNVFEFRRNATAAEYNYELYMDGVKVVANKPTWTKITKTSLIQIDITNGLLRFCVNNRCPHYLARKIDFPFRAVFRPASGFYAPGGFKDINYSYFEL